MKLITLCTFFTWCTVYFNINVCFISAIFHVVSFVFRLLRESTRSIGCQRPRRRTNKSGSNVSHSPSVTAPSTIFSFSAKRKHWPRANGMGVFCTGSFPSMGHNVEWRFVRKRKKGILKNLFWKIIWFFPLSSFFFNSNHTFCTLIWGKKCRLKSEKEIYKKKINKEKKAKEGAKYSFTKQYLWNNFWNSEVKLIVTFLTIFTKMEEKIEDWG